jgi:hypothetical protein
LFSIDGSRRYQYQRMPSPMASRKNST